VEPSSSSSDEIVLLRSCFRIRQSALLPPLSLLRLSSSSTHSPAPTQPASHNFTTSSSYLNPYPSTMTSPFSMKWCERDGLGYGREGLNPQWPNKAKIAVNFVRPLFLLFPFLPPSPYHTSHRSSTSKKAVSVPSRTASTDRKTVFTSSSSSA
jgi:hypothetical protein